MGGTVGGGHPQDFRHSGRAGRSDRLRRWEAEHLAAGRRLVSSSRVSTPIRRTSRRRGPQSCRGAWRQSVGRSVRRPSSLPYVDNLVNLVVAENLGKVAMAEVMRVLCPGGVAYVKQKRGMDQDGQALAGRDRRVDPLPARLRRARRSPTICWPDSPAGLHWTGGPFWSRAPRHHGQHASHGLGRRAGLLRDGRRADRIDPTAVALRADRPRRLQRHRPLEAAAGRLVQRPLSAQERPRLDAAEAGGRRATGSTSPPGVGQNLLCLDAATGKVLRTYDDTATTFELIVSDGVIFAASTPTKSPATTTSRTPTAGRSGTAPASNGRGLATAARGVVKAIRAEGGELLWQRKTPVAPMTLGRRRKHVCFYDGKRRRGP